MKKGVAKGHAWDGNEFLNQVQLLFRWFVWIEGCQRGCSGILLPESKVGFLQAHHQDQSQGLDASREPSQGSGFAGQAADAGVKRSRFLH